MTIRAGVAAVIVALMLAGCDGRDEASILPRPQGFHPERFPDIRMPPGFALREGRDQLAVTYAGGAVRRLDVSLIAKPDDHQDPSEAMAWFARVLPPSGWRAVAAEPDASVRTWHRRTAADETEELQVETGRSGTRAVVHVTLAPAVLH
ncbi:MAG TPA: hypothetical protein VEL07_19895 [Planctomycetota bacterium]|nr:hypothetical protein [Planctomycetota bacterium]